MAISLSARQWITRALMEVRVIAPGEPVRAEDYQTGFELAQELIDNWNTQALTVTSVKRTVFDLTADKGGPDDPYTIGTGGDFDTDPAERPNLIRNAALLDNTNASQPFEMFLPVITDDAYAYTAIKSLSNDFPTQLYYSPTSPLGTIILWPIPNTAANDLVLYTDLLPQQVFTLDDVYVCPSGSLGALRLGLAAKMIGSFDVPEEIAQRVERNAVKALSDFKSINAKPSDLSFDLALTNTNGGSYNIYTDQGGA